MFIDERAVEELVLKKRVFFIYDNFSGVERTCHDVDHIRIDDKQLPLDVEQTHAAMLNRIVSMLNLQPSDDRQTEPDEE
jgi:hypothetical protein